jgi:hypothetical protein
MGNAEVRSRQREHPEIKLQIINFYRVWRNKGYRDFGLERIIRLFLVGIQFFFPGLYIRHIGGKYGGFLGRRLATEIYILLKLTFPVLILFFGWQGHLLLILLAAYLMLETMLYLTSMIFLSVQFSHIISYRRSLISLFVNFMEISVSYGCIYLAGAKEFPGFFNHPFDSGMHAVYFSFITSATIGYGDLFPVHHLARLLVLSQVVFSFVFIGLIFNFFASKAHEPGDYSRIPGKQKMNS